MATQKPISTISYNTEAFLVEKLNAWVDAHIIQAYQYIYHKGEDGDKDHIHLRVEPNKKLDPMDLSDSLREFVQGEELPRGCRPWRPSKEEDWYLYAVHNDEYLKLKYNGGDKGEKLPYDYHDIKVSNGYDLDIAFVRALAYLKHTNANVATRIQQGENPLTMVQTGENPFVVNAIMRTVAQNDYQRLNEEFSHLQVVHYRVLDAISRAGFELMENEDGSFELLGRGE